MKISSISHLMTLTNNNRLQDKKVSTNPVVREETTGIPGMYAYRDYNISFGARLFRSPQNFYEQDFNEENMPRSLHEYIYETGDPAFKRSIPPAQAMKEVFGKIEDAKDLDEVKRMFPNEPLFANLSSKPKRKSREGLLGMINLLKEDPSYADKTLFKNGKNDLGMYIIKKIYIEGKTLKEINKDFNKDVSVYFKSYDITPQDYSAFGIRFPERPFWKSFIATREDFPYVYIPRTGVNGGTGGGTKTSGTQGTRSADVDHTPKPRKYKLKDYQKKQLTDDIIEAKGDAQAIEKKVIKRFKKDDPEASFIVKYLSPIMTVAADKVHLSEEMRYFTEEEKENGKTVKGATMFERFWKANPFLLKEYSQAITDTIENGEFYKVRPHLNTVNMMGLFYYDFHEWGIIFCSFLWALLFGLVQGYYEKSRSIYSLLAHGFSMNAVVLSFFSSWVNSFELWMFCGVILIISIVISINFKSRRKANGKA